LSLQRYGFHHGLGGLPTAYSESSCESTVLTPFLTTVRLFIHVLAASIWVGGQIVLAGLVPAVRGMDARVTKALANQFNRLAWPSYFVLLATGVWNMFAVHFWAMDSAWQTVLWSKIGLVLFSGLSAWLHTKSKSPAGLAIWGSMTALSALAAMFMGIMLATAI